MILIIIQAKSFRCFLHLNNYIKHLNYRLSWLDVDVEPVVDERDELLAEFSDEDLQDVEEESDEELEEESVVSGERLVLLSVV